MAKKPESRNYELPPDPESEGTNFDVTLRRPISFLRSMSLPSYEKVNYEGRKCKKMETPPPNYHKTLKNIDNTPLALNCDNFHEPPTYNQITSQN